MDVKLFSLILKKLGDSDLEDFEYKNKDVIYGFKNIGNDEWVDDGSGKYQYKDEQGQLIEMDENYKEIQLFNFGVSRCTTRTGSYYSDYYYDSDSYEAFKIKEVLIPERIIPAHIEKQFNKLDIDLSKVIDEEEENQKRIEAERIRLEEEAKLENDRLAKLYPMNNSDIIKMVNKNFKKRGIIKFGINEMRKEYFEIVVAKNLESKEWIEYHKERKGE